MIFRLPCICNLKSISAPTLCNLLNFSIGNRTSCPLQSTQQSPSTEQPENTQGHPCMSDLDQRLLNARKCYKNLSLSYINLQTQARHASTTISLQEVFVFASSVWRPREKTPTWKKSSKNSFSTLKPALLTS